MLGDLKPLVPYLKRYRRGFFWGGVSVVLSNAIWILFPQVLRIAIDDLNHGVTQQKILRYAGLLVAVSLAKGVFLFLTRWIIIGISRDIEFDLRNDLFRPTGEAIGQLLCRASHRRHHGAHDERPERRAHAAGAGDHVQRQHGPVFDWRGHLSAAHQPVPDAGGAGAAALASVLVQTMGRKIHERFERIQAMFSEISAQAQENFSGARLVRAFAQEEPQIASFEAANRENVRRGLRLVQLMGMLWPTLEFILGLSLAITLLVGGHEVLTNRISVGQFVAFNTYMMMLTWPVIALGWVVNLVQRGTASVIRIHELMTDKPEIDDAAADRTLNPDTRLKGKIEFRHLNFAYTDTEGKPVEVLHDINLEIPAGTSLALVGPTGSGKSTLVGLIARIYDAHPGDADPGDAAPGDAEAGSVLIDDRPVRDYPLATLRANIGFVPQETFLFSESIRENIAFGAPYASTEDVLAAAEAAHIRREFEDFPHGMDTAVGERGITLSGGQKQRTAIARAVVRDPAILVLDDALASVDTYTEETILRQLREVMRDRTTIFISHRISTVRHADRIAVLVNGRIAELGTHEELLSLGHFYAGLYEKQLLEEELAVTG